jgi:predicted deacylase
MHLVHHLLSGSPPGTRREVVSAHYGPQGDARKAYVQASLHADELPGMLVAQHLQQRLAALESEGRLRGEVVVVSAANPIGLAQTVLQKHQGRFDLGSGENFNRHYPALFETMLPRLQGRLTANAQANTAVVRALLRELIAEQKVASEVESLRQTLHGLACDAEIVLDLHCDSEALLHLYTSTALWPEAEALARFTGAEASLLADESGDNPFDEACAQIWRQLRDEFGARFPIPLACLSATLELRGERDVSHPLAMRDADALIAFLTHRGLVGGALPVLPLLLNPATPLAGTELLKAPASGLLVFVRTLGDRVRAGDVIAELIDPVSGELHTIASRIDGLFFAHESQRYARAGSSVAKIAGAVPIRTGKLTTE